MILLYDLILFLVALLSFPAFLYNWVFHKKYRNSLTMRLGFGLPKIDKGTRSLIWIHAVSMGETKAVAKLAKRLKARGDNPVLVISTVTETGFAEAKRAISEADYHLFLPFDFNGMIQPLVKMARPDLVILCETDFWYHFLKCSKAMGAKIVLVNGKLSEKSLKRFKMIPWFSQKLFSLIDLFCLQSEHYRARFEHLGISAEKMVVTGNLKLDSDVPRMDSQALAHWKITLGINPHDKILVVGSSHDPEEKLILDVIKKVWEKVPQLTVLFVPRHPERFREVAELIQKETSHKKRLILIDQMGQLMKCYQLADLAIVCGSFTSRVGGHNIIEPSWYGVPVLFGPFLHSQPELLELSLRYGAGFQVLEEQLEDKIVQILQDNEMRSVMGEAGLRLVSDLAGTTERTFHVICKKCRK